MPPITWILLKIRIINQSKTKAKTHMKTIVKQISIPECGRLTKMELWKTWLNNESYTPIAQIAYKQYYFTDIKQDKQIENRCEKKNYCKIFNFPVEQKRTAQHKKYGNHKPYDFLKTCGWKYHIPALCDAIAERHVLQ